MRITLRQLRAFLLGSKSASFTDAANRANLSQPGFSLLIRQLEAELDAKLFDRTTRRVEITQTGRQFAEQLERILGELDDLLNDTRTDIARQRGHVLLGLIPSVAATLGGRIAARMRSEFPGISLTIREEQASPLVHLVSDNIIDFAIGVMLPPGRDVSFLPLMLDRMVFLFHPNEPAANSANPTLKEISPLRYIAFSQSSVKQHVRNSLEEYGIGMEPAMEVASMATAVAMVREGLGFAILPELALEMSDASGLKIVPVTPLITRKIGILTNNQHSMSPAAQAAFKIAREVTSAYDHERRRGSS